MHMRPENRCYYSIDSRIMARIAQGLLLIVFTLRCPAQTTDGAISGRIVNSQTGDPISGVRVHATHLSSNLGRSAVTGPSGFFLLPLLPPGVYRMRIDGGRLFQAQEVH